MDADLQLDLINHLSTIADALSRIADVLDARPLQPAAQVTASQPLPANVIVFHASTLTVSIDERGAPVYRAKGDKFQKFGVRVWDEMLPILGIDPAGLRPGPNPISIQVRAVTNEKGSPKKVIGLA